VKLVAGYATSANVSTISAQWRVPVLLSRSKNGEAATWIGAQGSTNPVAFIQLGTLESRINGETIEPIESNSAFWSDTHLDYYPVTIPGLVHGGDLIRADMIATAVGWRLQIINQTEHWSDSFVTNSASMKGYDRGEWVQEDPEDPVTGAGTPYPSFTDVAFNEVLVNGHSPHTSLADALWMSENGQVLAPRSLRGDRFSVATVRLTHAQAQYMEDARPVDVAAAATVYQLRGRNGSLVSYLEALAQFDSQMRYQTWPALATPEADSLADTDAAYATSLRALIEAGTSAAKPLISKELRESEKDLAAANRLRLSIGLPPAIEVTASEAKS
jgi:hypothetical protein